jgi:hypothetical protein
MSPVHVTVTVWPLLDGTVILLVAGVEATLNMANKAPSKQRVVAISARGLKRPDWELGVFRMVIFPSYI